MPWMETGVGHVELLIGLDNKQWLPAHVEDSWDPDDDMRLMRSVFSHRYMITDGWGRDLLPPDNAPGDPAGAQGGAVEQADAAQEVQLPEYRGWSQSTGNPGNGGGSGAAAPKGGCLGVRPNTCGVAPSQGTPPPGEGQLRGVDRKGPAKSLAIHQHRRSASELRTLRLREERSQDSRWYRHQRRDLPLTHRLHRDGAAGAGSDHAREVEFNRGQSGCSLRACRLPLTQGECQAPRS